MKNSKKKMKQKQNKMVSLNSKSYGLNPRQIVTLRYSDTFSVTQLALGGGQNQFNMNSLFDPDRSGTGHQPYRYDQLAVFYTRYLVTKLRFRITMLGGGGNIFWVVCPTNGALNAAITGAATFNAVCELPFAQSSGVSVAGSPNFVVDKTVVLHTFSGVTTEQYRADDRFQAVVNTDPVELLILTVGRFNPSATVSTDLHYMVELFYTAEMFDPAIIGQS